ncbi:MAG: DUF362 domain-containing protein [Planctomycetota bacterium]
MDSKISRRSFIRKSVDAGAASLLGGALFSNMGCQGTGGKSQAPLCDLAVVEGDDRHAMTEKAVDLLGGMEQFVPRGARVCILPNAQRNHPGTYTKPEIVQSVIDMCCRAGAAEVNCLSWLFRKNWEATGLDKVVEEAGASLKIVDLKDESRFKPVALKGAKILEEVRIMDLFFENDVFINMPITKDHAGNRFTGTMKNLMGLNSPKSNRTFHTGNFKNDDIEHLDQCIADLNLAIRPTLCVVDATEFIITNGPFGPGELHKPRKVVAGTDPVAIDALCSTLWGLKPEEIIMIERAHKHGLGEIDFSKKKIEETVI